MAIKVTLLTHTPNPEQTVAMAAKLCYSPSGIEDIRDEILCSVKNFDIMITVYSFFARNACNRVQRTRTGEHGSPLHYGGSIVTFK